MLGMYRQQFYEVETILSLFLPMKWLWLEVASWLVSGGSRLKLRQPSPTSAWLCPTWSLGFLCSPSFVFSPALCALPHLLQSASQPLIHNGKNNNQHLNQAHINYIFQSYFLRFHESGTHPGDLGLSAISLVFISFHLPYSPTLPFQNYPQGLSNSPALKINFFFLWNLDVDSFIIKCLSSFFFNKLIYFHNKCATCWYYLLKTSSNSNWQQFFDPK